MVLNILYMALFSGILPITCIKLCKVGNPIHRSVLLIEPFVWFLAFASVLEAIDSLILRIDSSYWLRLYDLLKFAALFYFFHELLKPYYKKFFYFMAGFYLSLYVLLLVFWKESSTLLGDAVFSNLTALLVFICSGLWLKKVFTGLEIPVLWRFPLFYIISGFLLYYASTFFPFLLSVFIFNSDILYFESFWLLNIVASLILHIFLIIAIWRAQVK